ncbi:MAG: helix-hairpin-helix domain-containing protein [Bacteroidales bacterium]|nr:helix-hairpin-helix domain-containing protein [Bacteroidales bacterium]
MKKISSSFAAGAIALVFAVLGYQTALLVQYQSIRNSETAQSAVVPEKEPAESPGAEAGPKSPSGNSYAKNSVAKNSAAGKSSAKKPAASSAARKEASTVAAAPAAKAPEAPAEPTKQALEAPAKPAKQASNHPLKAYRLDINAADSADFDMLPGIGPYFARKMVEYREQLGGYSFPEQLMDIYRFDEERYNKIKDLISLESPSTPFPLWTASADSLRLHPYIRTASTARSIVFFRKHNPPEKCTVQELEKAGIISAEIAAKLARCNIEFR